MIEKHQEEHYGKIETIESLWQEGKLICLALPDEDYPILKEVIQGS